MDHATLTGAAGLILGKLATSGATAPIKAALRHLGEQRAAATLDRVYAEIVEEIALEWPAALSRLEARLAAEGRDLRMELAGKIDERAATVLFLRLFSEAMESAQRERTRMLCAGMAGVFKPDMETERKERVSRAVAKLWPSDLVQLRKVVENHLDGGADGAKIHILGPAASMEALVAADCFVIPDGGDGPTLETRDGQRRWTGYITLTDLGRGVLAFLDTYQADAVSK